MQIATVIAIDSRVANAAEEYAPTAARFPLPHHFITRESIDLRVANAAEEYAPTAGRFPLPHHFTTRESIDLRQQRETFSGVQRLTAIMQTDALERAIMKHTFTVYTVLFIALFATALMAEDPAGAVQRIKMKVAMNHGNFKDAFEGFSKRVLDPQDDPEKAGEDLTEAVSCLRSLGRVDEEDDFREKAIAVHAQNWRVLAAAAASYMQGEQYGFIIAGKFHRGNHRGGDGQYSMSFERDRIRALQLMQQGMASASQEPDALTLSNFYLQFAQHLMSSGYQQSWRLQYLGDLSKLPDYDPANFGYGGDSRGAPVDTAGNPVFYKIPKDFVAASSDGERWRWCLSAAIQAAPPRIAEVQLLLADFLQQQFDVQTAAYSGGFYRGGAEDEGGANEEEEKKGAGIQALRTLPEDETIARLASGIKRFKLPDEFNFIKIYKDIADNAKDGRAERALTALAQIFENRQQYDKAADYWKRNIQTFRDANKVKHQRLDQIIGNWGQFEALSMQTAGAGAEKGAKVDYRFRNGVKVNFEAYEIDVDKLLGDVKAYLKSNPKQLDWQKLDISNIGYRLVEQQQKQYLGKQTAAWELELKPRAGHFDKRVSVVTPLQKPGAYLLTASIAGGNTSRIVVWVADTVILKKQLDKASYYFVADAQTGRPVPGAQLEFFGYQQRYVNNNTFEVDTAEFASQTDADGQLMPKQDNLKSQFQWIVTAKTADGRFAYMGFSNLWYGEYHDYEYNQTKVFTITDRPVYRPSQSVKFKCWIGQAKYDVEGKSRFAGTSYKIQIQNPKGDKVLEKTFKTDEYGGLDGEFPVEKDATLGVYSINVANIGGSSFRVEEYKKPEFEVKVDAPSEPVMLGEKVTATISAKYYFGAPVTEAKVKYKVLRYNYSANWYPAGQWDWFYAPGYWWFASDYTWYPGWNRWGCCRPSPWWWGAPQQAPEVVMENELPIGADGTLKIEFDTAMAKAVHGDTDHKYELSAEVTDQSRRTITGSGTVMVARNPFKVYVWVDRGHYRIGDAIEASFSAQTLDNKPVKGKGGLKLFKITYDKDSKPVETLAQEWAEVDTDDQGKARMQIKASEAGQFRLSYKVTDTKGHAIEGGYVFCITGEGFDSSAFRFNDIELVTDKREYKPGEKVQLMLNTNRIGGTVLLFIRPANGMYLPPKIIQLKGKSTLEEIEVEKKDMPDFFIEALTIGDGKVHTEMREIIVPPESRVLNVSVAPSATQYKPGEKAKARIVLKDAKGQPFVGTTAITVYDKSVEYISGGSNVPEIKAHFWKWRRNHQPQTQSSLDKYMANLVRNGELAMQYLGAFGYAELETGLKDGEQAASGALGSDKSGFGGRPASPMAAAKGGQSLNGAMAADAVQRRGANRMEMQESLKKSDDSDRAAGEQPQAEPPPQTMVEPALRKNFADSAYWTATLNTNADGSAEIEWPMPENLTTWKIKVWAMGEGTRVGQGEADVTTAKNLLVRLQAPRFFTQKDEVVLSANIHNYLKGKKSVQAILELDGPSLESETPLELKKIIEIDANSEKRVDWRVKVSAPGEAVVRVKALTNEESDAMEMRFPVYIHGMLKTESFAGAMARDKESASVAFNVPAERQAGESRLEVRYSPTLAGAMVDALPYLVDYPHDCTEQTLNRFLPTVTTQRILLRMNLNLKDVEQKITNLNAQEIGDDAQRAKQWKRFEHNPVFDEVEVTSMVRAGIKRLAAMQVADGGWGWFSGWGEKSYPHTTAYVVHGLQMAGKNEVALDPGMLERGVQWLKSYQAKEKQLLKNAQAKIEPSKTQADNLDAFVYMVLCDAQARDEEMREFIYRDRNNLAVYAKAMFGMALKKEGGQKEKLDMIIKNIEQYLVQDNENQTAYLKLPEDNYWWYWYGSEYEAQAYYLKLLSAIDPKSEKASRLVKYLINNRKHASYWNSTRDTAVCIEAIAEYLVASGEDSPEFSLEIDLDGKKAKDVTINASNLFSFDNKLILTGQAISAGAHTLEFKKKGAGPLYFNVYSTNFTLEDHIAGAGLEIKVARKYYKLTRVDKQEKVEGAHGQVIDQKVEKYERHELADLATLKSGDLVEIELEIDSKNDYEYILFEDMKAAGFEPVDTRSGYNGNSLNAYMELRDERVCFFARALARGKHSVSYRMRAEIPGTFNALPTRVSAMYAPELKANSDEIKLNIED